MDLGRLFSKRKAHSIVLLCVAFSSTVFAASEFSEVTYESLRSRCVTLISGAQQRVWLASEFFADGDLVQSLLLAQMRGLDIRVVLSDRYATHYESQGPSLVKEKLKVQIKTLPDTWGKSLLVVDQTALTSASFLAPRYIHTRIRMREEPLSTEAQRFFDDGKELRPQVGATPSRLRNPAVFQEPANIKPILSKKASKENSKKISRVLPKKPKWLTQREAQVPK